MLDLLEEGLLKESRSVSEHLWSRLESLKETNSHIKELRGKGFMVGIVLDGDPSLAARISGIPFGKGILIDLTQKTIIRLLPPLTLTKEEVDTFISAFTEELNHLTEEQ